MAFDYPTNFSNGTNIDSLGNLIAYGNYVTSGYLSLAFLFIVFIMSFLVSATINSKKALLSSSFITFIFSVYFLRLDLINPAIVFALLVTVIISAIGTKSEASNY